MAALNDAARPVLPKPLQAIIFSNSNEILAFHRGLLRQLEDLVTSWSVCVCVRVCVCVFDSLICGSHCPYNVHCAGHDAGRMSQEVLAPSSFAWPRI